MSKSDKILPIDYGSFLTAVKERVRAAQYAALRAVNTELVGLYWDIGRMIVERQANGTLGKAVVQQLALDLQMEFPGVGGFSPSNLWRMKAFFEAYREQAKLAPLVREIGWSHNLVILDSLQRQEADGGGICPTRRPQADWGGNLPDPQNPAEAAVRAVAVARKDCGTAGKL